MHRSRHLALVVVISSLALALALRLGFPGQALPVVHAGITPTPTFTPTNTPEPPTSTPVPPTSTPVVVEVPETGGLLDYDALVWLTFSLLLGAIVVWGLWRPGRTRRA